MDGRISNLFRQKFLLKVSDRHIFLKTKGDIIMGLLSIGNGGGNFENQGVKEVKIKQNTKSLAETINQQGGVFGFGGPKKVVTEINDDGSKLEKQYDKDGHLMKEIVYKDVNGDGKEDIYSVTSHHEAKPEWDMNASSSTYIDEDGDGYNDVLIRKEYDEKGKLKTETKTIAEDINSVKNRPHGPWEIQNREMEAHKSGIYIM